jgi:hypothetical protein
VYKEFHHEGEYAKGDGKAFTFWLQTHHGGAFFMPFERAAAGRQDLAFDGAVPVFANHVLCCTYLRDKVFTPGHKNVLEDFLWHSLSCVEMLALARVFTLFDLLLSVPLRWLCGSSAQLTDWSVYSMGNVLDLVESFLERVAADGEVLLDPAEDVFREIADSQQAFRDWRAELAKLKIRSPDRSETYPWYERVLAEAREPANESVKQTTDMTVQLAAAMATAGLEKMRDPKIAISDWLSSQNGKYSTLHSAEMHRATVGAHITNDRVESNFGCYDAVIRIFRTISVDAAAGLTQAMRMHYLDPPKAARRPNISHARKPGKQPQQQPSSVGFFGRLPEALQEAIVEAARKLAQTARGWERADRREQAEYREMKRAQNLQLQLEGLAVKGAIAVERFQAYATRAEKDFETANRIVDSLPSAAQQVAWLRFQIELRVCGFGWADLGVTWKHTDESVAEQVARLRSHLKEVLREEKVRERRGEVPDEPALPDFEAKSLKQLGSATADSLALARRALCSPEQLRQAIERECERREAAGFADKVQAVQPPNAPPLDASLVETQLEICWHYTSTVDGKTKVRRSRHCIISHPCLITYVHAALHADAHVHP